MWKNKKVALLAALAVAVLIGSIVGVTVAVAQTGNGDESQPQAQNEALLDRVSEIYAENTGVAIDVQQLKDAFAQARSEMQTEALQNRLQNLVDQGTLTQDQADQYLQWWQSKPDVPLSDPGELGFGGHGFPGGPVEIGQGR
jgi:multidrug efflux pump subunit AcrA (membrane-fusion protein)